MGKSKVDDDLTELLTKLYTMQEDVGAKPKSSEDEKKTKAENIAVMGTGRNAQAKGSRFLDLRSMIIQGIKDIHGKLQEVKELETAGYGGDNPKQLIKLQAEIRQEIRQAQDEWKELEGIYKKEARKKRSKFTPEELETQAQLVQQLYEQIEKIREAQMAGFARGGRAENDAAASILGGGTFGGTSAAGGGWNGGKGGGAALTEGQQMQIQELEQRDADFDRQLDEIGEGIADLGEIAQLQSEEVKHQSVMLDHLNDKIDSVNDRTGNVNARMKETLEEVGRSSDKLIVDIICIVLAIGFAAVFYNIAQG
eukprot:CAMPEP_0119013058 /NCGR_PEP_ID=MMETSP1176-20130426/7816_1 /TAXON_ID=265551 /ORGANISM="Synedropsis recta cf, Strain CCMP1620" /LENGTH=309 /DNA_ID=CAMNT_0006966107 /DNA_START=56 /DNA_END=985 /DNA_ORIENTATION=-